MKFDSPPAPNAPLPPPILADFDKNRGALPKRAQFGGTWLTRDMEGSSGGLANKTLTGQ